MYCRVTRVQHITLVTNKHIRTASTVRCNLYVQEHSYASHSYAYASQRVRLTTPVTVHDKKYDYYAI